MPFKTEKQRKYYYSRMNRDRNKELRERKWVRNEESGELEEVSPTVSEVKNKGRTITYYDDYGNKKKAVVMEHLGNDTYKVRTGFARRETIKREDIVKIE